MFITDEDYRVVIGETALKAIAGVSPENRRNAEREAIEEMASYLRPRYDLEAVFSATGEQRNPMVVMYAVDIALYHLSASMAQRLGSEVRKERYERAIKWLEGVAKGLLVPDLPTPNSTSTNGKPATFRYGTQKKLNHNW